MDDDSAHGKRRGGRIVLFLILAALILLVGVGIYTWGYRSPPVIRGAMQPPTIGQPHLGHSR